MIRNFFYIILLFGIFSSCSINDKNHDLRIKKIFEIIGSSNLIFKDYLDTNYFKIDDDFYFINGNKIEIKGHWYKEITEIKPDTIISFKLSCIPLRRLYILNRQDKTIKVYQGEYNYSNIQKTDTTFIWNYQYLDREMNDIFNLNSPPIETHQIKVLNDSTFIIQEHCRRTEIIINSHNEIRSIITPHEQITKSDCLINFNKNGSSKLYDFCNMQITHTDEENLKKTKNIIDNNL